MEVFDLSAPILAAILLAAFATSVVHGTVGLAGGILLAAILSHVFDAKSAITLVTCALLFSHGSRVSLHFRDIDWRSVSIVLLFSAPGIALGAWVFSYLTSTTIAALMAVFLSLSIPIKYLAKRRQLQTSDSILAMASTVWGGLAGNVIGPGFVLAPFLLGRGIGRLAFVGSMAVIVLSMNLLKVLVFGMTGLMTGELLALGAAIGLVTIPGNWLGKKILLSLTDSRHQLTINILTGLLIFNFLYLYFYP